jgi:DNA-binding CsgD family transcriptional regulator
MTPPADGSLSARQLEILALVADGYTTREIAERLFISEQTVSQHVKNINRRLRARNRSHAVRIGYDRGLLQAFDDGSAAYRSGS